MAVIKGVSSKAGIGRAIDYVTKKEKTEKKLVSGHNCQPETAAKEMQLTKEAWGKVEGRTYKHYVQSFHKDEQLTPEQAHKIAQEFAEKCDQFKGFEVLIATHKDRDHIHTHFIVNSVSFEDGHKFRQSKGQYQKMKDLSDEIVKAHGLHVTEKGKTFEGADREETTAYTKEQYRKLKKAETGQTKSYVQNIALAVMEERERATSKEEFIRNLQERGIGVNWQDNHKYITFIDLERQQQGEKQCKVRDNKLSQYYNVNITKESLMDEFERNAQRTAEQTERREQQLKRAAEQVRRTDRRAEQKNSRSGTGDPHIERKDQESAEQIRSIQRDRTVASGERGHHQKLGEASRTMDSASQAVGAAKRDLEKAAAGLRKLQESIGRTAEQQEDPIEQQFREQEQLNKEILGAVGKTAGELERGISEITKQIIDLGKKQRDLNEKQRSRRAAGSGDHPAAARVRRAIRREGERADQVAEKMRGVGTKQQGLRRKQHDLGGSIGRIGEQIERMLERMQQIRLRRSRGRGR